jgi:hypothetical protein
MTMVAMLRWAALLDEAGELRGADPEIGPASEAGGHRDLRLSR